MYASATISVWQLISVHPPFLQAPAWLSVLSRDQKFLFSGALAYETYWRLTISVPSGIFMNANGCEQIPDIKKMLCRNEMADISQEDPYWRLGIDTWDLLPRTWATAASTVCLPVRWVGWKIHSSTGWASQIPIGISKEMLFYILQVLLVSVPGAEELHVPFLKA